jgi:hypothetical protein
MVESSREAHMYAIVVCCDSILLLPVVTRHSDIAGSSMPSSLAFAAKFQVLRLAVRNSPLFDLFLSMIMSTAHICLNIVHNLCLVLMRSAFDPSLRGRVDPDMSRILEALWRRKYG